MIILYEVILVANLVFSALDVRWGNYGVAVFNFCVFLYMMNRRPKHD